ncbi:ABC transporter substrate-binding protein, partial [Bradyrhizobium sp. 145]|uniref:ABC transporter substrate-binding protein n=1 Tax=Bradyrhizobium sp. 145 TaxID=2782621 RepID=UPI001FFB7F6B
MKRREFIAGTAVLLVSPTPLRAQGVPRRIGFLGGFLDSQGRNAWRSGLREKGWIEGKNLLVEYRFAETPDRMATLAAELVALTPDLVIALGPSPALALKSATAIVPIVFVVVADPVGLGLIQSLARPGGNITGLASWVPGDWTAKQIQILQELVPGASKIALLVNPS